MEVDRDCLGTGDQPVWDGGRQGGVHLLLQIGAGRRWHVGGEMTTHGVGMGGVEQIGTDGLDRRGAGGGGHDNAPQGIGLTAGAVRRERDVVTQRGDGIMPGTLIGQAHWSVTRRRTHQAASFVSELEGLP